MASGDKVTRIYGNFRGVDFRGEEVNLLRSPDSCNMWRDYKVIESISTRPKMQKVVDGIIGPIHGIFFYTVNGTEMMLVHASHKIYKVVNDEIEELYNGASSNKSEAYVFNGIWYFKDKWNFLQYDGTELKDVIDGGCTYVPTTTISRKPEGGGTEYEDVNMLSRFRWNSFVGDGESTEYHLDTMELDTPPPDTPYGPGILEEAAWELLWKYYICVMVNDEELKAIRDFTVNAYDGIITFKTPPPAPLTDGQDNVKIKFRKSNDEASEKIRKCSMMKFFDNRAFFSGNEDYPDMIWHSSLEDPTYCSDLDYYKEGIDGAKVTGMVAGNNALWVFKEPSDSNSTIFYHRPTIDSEYGKIYPSTHSSISTGCIGKAINFNDDIVFFSDRGMEGISGDVTTEQVIAHRSSMVDRKLLAEPKRNTITGTYYIPYEDMLLVEWEGYLLVIIGKHVYLADSRAKFTNEDHLEYEWFYWEFPTEITCAREHNGVLYLGCSAAASTDSKCGVFKLVDVKESESDPYFKCYWVTPKDKFKHPQYLKTTNKKGCVVEATGDVFVGVKTDKTDEFQPIDSYKGVEDYFVSRIKQKKFKDIQLKFSSGTRFNLESVTLECFVGGYTKR
jgi:hypothetical protein